MKKTGNIGREFERMAVYGRVAPDVWMMHATGSRVSAKDMLASTERTLDRFELGD